MEKQLTFYVLDDDGYGPEMFVTFDKTEGIEEWDYNFQQWSTAERTADDIREDYLDAFKEITLFVDSGSVLISGQRNASYDDVAYYLQNGVRGEGDWTPVDEWRNKFADND